MKKEEYIGEGIQAKARPISTREEAQVHPPPPPLYHNSELKKFLHFLSQIVNSNFDLWFHLACDGR
jgi:hypothetical protein